LHYHPETEIIHVVKSFGTRIIGESIQNFSEDDLVMVGSGVPHVWRNDDVFYQGDENLEAVVRVIHFNENFWGEGFTNLPEMSRFRKLFHLARHGISFSDGISETILQYFDIIFRESGQARIIAFINMLDYISGIKEFDLLMKTEYIGNYNQIDCEKVNKIYEYLLNNYIVGVDFQEVALMLNMSLPSLCRFFKQRTNRNISMALNEIRVNQACKLLSNEKYSATQICFMVGYANYSHFNEQFKKITGITPLKYKRKAPFYALK
jgi:AraC-like DNA-binding protein